MKSARFSPIAGCHASRRRRGPRLRLGGKVLIFAAIPDDQ
jgi:hypothetical protein